MKAPRFISDLYADLRDRKLLPLVVVLLLAMVAVPVLLKNETEPPPPVDPAASTAAVPEGIPTAAVLVSNPGLRDYRERLDALRSKNPFAGEPVKIDSKSDKAQVQDLTEAAADAGLTDLAVPASGGSSSSETITESSTSTSTSTDTTVIEDNGGSGSNGGNGASSDPEVVELAFRVDVEVGPAGDTQRRKNVKLLTVLPSQSNPVNLYLGASEDGKHAVFLVSDDVVTARGDGRCLPDPANCEFVNMKAGDEMKFGYAPNGEPDTFILKVLDIRLERNDDTADSNRRDATSDPNSAQAGLEAWLGL